MVALVRTYFTQHPKGNETMFSKSLESHLQELGIFPVSTIEDMDRVLDTRHVYSKKGYYNDPRDRNGEVSF